MQNMRSITMASASVYVQHLNLTRNGLTLLLSAKETDSDKDTSSISYTDGHFKSDLLTTESIPLSTVTQADLLTAEQFSIAMQVLLQSRYVILPLALLATCVNVVVFADRAMRGATSTYVLALCVGQILYLLIDILHQIILKETATTSAFFIWYVIYVKTYLATLVLSRTAYVVSCLVSIERLYAIIRPLHVKTFVLVRYPKSFVAVSYIFGLVYHLYYLVRLQIVKIGEGVYGVKWLDVYLENKHLMDGIGLSSQFVMIFIPLTVQIILNVITIIALRRHTVIRKSMTSTSSGEAGLAKLSSDLQRERQLTVTILGVTACYVLLALPITIQAILYFLNVPGFSTLFGARYTRFFNVFLEFSNNCTFLSCFADFFGFLLLSSAYRRVLVRRFRLSKFVTSVGRSTADQQDNVSDGKTFNSEVIDSTAFD